MDLIVSLPVFLLQGALDVRYLAARYENGKRWVESYMEKQHRFRSIPMANAHADILIWQQEVSNKFLGHCDADFPKIPHLMIHYKLNVVLIVLIGDHRVRFTIMLLDCSLYPSGRVQYRLQLISFERFCC